MHPFFQRPGFRRFRVTFRWCRITLWLAVFLVMAAAYLHLLGLPDFLKRPLLERLLAKGVVAQFSNIQLGWGPSILIENAAFSRSDQPLSPRLSAGEAELALNWNALLHFKIALHSLRVAGAELDFPISETNGDGLLFTNVLMDMQFSSNNVVRVDNCRGVFHGIQIDLIGAISHASSLRSWRFPLGGNTNQTSQTRLRATARIVNGIHFAGTPLLRIEASADGRDMNTFHAELNFAAYAAQTPWGNITNLVMNAACARLIHSGSEPVLEIDGSARDVDAPRGRGGKISASAVFSRDSNSNLEAAIKFDGARLRIAQDTAGSNWIGAARVLWQGSATLASSNFMPLQVTGKLTASQPETPWGLASEVALQCNAVRRQNPSPPDPDWGLWIPFCPWTLDWQADLRGLTSPKLRVDRLAFSGHWLAPQVVIENLQADLYGGPVTARAALDIASRELRSSGATGFNPLSISQLLNPAASNWLAQLAFVAPPKVNAQLRLTLPPWTHRPDGWRRDMASSLELAGNFTAGDSSFRQIPVRSARGDVTYKNRVWNVSRLHAVRPDGAVDLDYTSSPQDFHYVIDGLMDPKAAMPLIAPSRPHLLDDFTFTQPPEIHAQIWGHWHGQGTLGFTATVQAANFSVRGEKVSAFAARSECTNLILTIHDVALSNTQCQVEAPWLQVNCATKSVSLTNAAGTLEPAVLQQVFQKDSLGFLDVVSFDRPPSVSVSGSFSLTNPLATDLRFLINGHGLHYTNLFANRVAGEVNWTGQTVELTNISAGLYNNGTLKGWVRFDSAQKHGTDFHADFHARDIDLAALARGLSGKTNHIEGRLDGHLVLNGPNSANNENWRGHGNIYVHNALLWDIKLFGLFSPLLNLISPGWGHSRMREAVGNFVITNGTISSDKLQLVCQGFVLNLRGKVDRNRQINARLEAVLSREAPLFGPLISLAFTPLSKLFEYHISGPLRDPVVEPVYVPRFLMLLLRPFHTLKSLATPSTPADTFPP
jgi:hypothetical protein